jgi:hypothetical protein
MDGANKIVQHEKWDGKTATYIREINGDHLTVVSINHQSGLGPVIAEPFVSIFRPLIWAMSAVFADTNVFE